MRFFKPNQTFWDWLGQPQKIVVDLGCGDGDLVQEMLDRGIRCVGVDPHFFDRRPDAPMGLATNVIPLAANDVHEIWQSEVIILCCRPCHNGFPREVAEQMSDKAEFFYIGFGKNLAVDIGLPFYATPVETNVGDDDETIYCIEPDVDLAKR